MGSASATSGRTDFGISAPACRFGRWGPAAYWRAEDSFGDFFYALAAAFETCAQQPVFSFRQGRIPTAESLG